MNEEWARPAPPLPKGRQVAEVSRGPRARLSLGFLEYRRYLRLMNWPAAAEQISASRHGRLWRCLIQCKKCAEDFYTGYGRHRTSLVILFSFMTLMPASFKILRTGPTGFGRTPAFTGHFTSWACLTFEGYSWYAQLKTRVIQLSSGLCPSQRLLQVTTANRQWSQLI